MPNISLYAEQMGSSFLQYCHIRYVQIQNAKRKRIGALRRGGQNRPNRRTELSNKQGRSRGEHEKKMRATGHGAIMVLLGWTVLIGYTDGYLL